MKKILAAALLLALAPSASAAPPVFDVNPGFSVSPNPEPVRAEAAYDPLWFALKVTAGNGVGSGTPILSAGGKTLVLTNAHVARQDRTEFTVTAPGGKTYPARRVDGSTVRNTGPRSIAIDGVDLAVVEVDAELGAVQIATRVPTPGDQVFEWGYGMTTPNGAPALRTGTVVSNVFAETTLTSTINCVSGDSGSGVFNVKGELVGVSHGTGAGYSHHAVPLTEVHRFLGRPLLGRLFPRLADRLAARRDGGSDNFPPAPPTAPAPKGVAAAPAAPATPTPKAAPATPAPKAAPAAPVTMYRIGNGPWVGESEFRQQFPLGAADGGCANGKCPVAAPPPAARWRR